MARSPAAPGPNGKEGEGRSRWLRRLASGAVGTASLLAFAGVLLHAYGESRSSWTGRGSVLIKADPGPFKVKPDSPGGRAIPDRDKGIYDRIGAVPAGEPVERLLPLPEAPVSPPRRRPAAPEPPPAEAAPEAPAPPAEAKPAPERLVAKATEPAGPARPAPPEAEGGEFRLQLAALRSRDAADRAWKQLRNRHRKLLAGLSLAIEKKDLGPSKGVYYRLLAGPLSDREAARRLCAALAERKVGCLVVRR